MEHLEFAKYKELYETWTSLKEFSEMHPEYCDDLFKLGNEWKEFIKSNIKVNQVGVSTSST